MKEHKPLVYSAIEALQRLAGRMNGVPDPCELIRPIGDETGPDGEKHWHWIVGTTGVDITIDKDSCSVTVLVPWPLAKIADDRR